MEKRAALKDTPLRSGRAPLFLVFATLGATASTIPASLPAVAQANENALAGYFAAVPAMFFGLLLGVLLTSLLGARLSPKGFVLWGNGLQLAGFCFLTLAGDSTLFVTCSLLIGFGFGFVEAGGSILARALAGDGTARLLSALTAVVAVVAAVVPLLFAFTELGSHPGRGFWIVAGMHLVAFIAVAVSIPGRPAAEKGDGAAQRTHRKSARMLGAVLPIAVALALYVGVETLYAGWSAVLVHELFALHGQRAAIGTSIFWLLLAGGRYLAVFILGRGISVRRYLVVSAVLAAVNLLAAALIGEASLVILAVVLGCAVVCLGPCYSLVLGIGLADVPLTDARRLTGLLVACGAAGGSFLPAAVLLLTSTPIGPVMFVVTAFLTVGFGVLAGFGSGLVRRREPQDTSS